MISALNAIAAVLGCAIVGQPVYSCIPYALTPETEESAPTTTIPKKTGESIRIEYF